MTYKGFNRFDDSTAGCAHMSPKRVPILPEGTVKSTHLAT